MPSTITQQVLQVRYAEIMPDPEQPRKSFDEGGLDELARSMNSNGLLQPIVVRPILEGRKGTIRYMLVAGERRWRAARKLGWKTIPAIIRTDLTIEEAAKLQLLENIVRRDLNPVEEARAFKKMLDEGYSMQELSEAVGLAVSQISWRVQMLNAREDILHLVATGQVKPLMAFELSKLSLDNQNRAIRRVVDDGLGYFEVNKLCQALHAEEMQIEIFPETKLSEVQVRAVRTFTSGFLQICSVLNRIERMNEENPNGLAEAFLAEGATMEAQINASIRGLNRVKSILERARMQQLAVAPVN